MGRDRWERTAAAGAGAVGFERGAAAGAGGGTDSGAVGVSGVAGAMVDCGEYRALHCVREVHPGDDGEGDGRGGGAGEEGGGCGKEPLVLGLAKARSTKFNAWEAVRPVGRWPDTAEMIAELRRPRAGTLAFAAETQAELRDHFFPHLAFGDLDCYQWLVVPGQHGARHAVPQIEEIMADPGYPAS